MIALHNVHKKFGHNEVLRGIDLEVSKGEVVAILGPSGSGKTTLLRCINFLERADRGQMDIGGLKVDMHSASREEIMKVRQKTTMVFQNYNLFNNKNAIENIMEGLVVVKGMPPEEAREISEALLLNVGLADKAERFPTQLSGGEQQRIGIARALAMDPEVVLFDEPTSALDPELVGEVLDVIRKVANEGRTMIIVTHEVMFAREIADKVIFMDGGIVVESGRPEDVLVRPNQERTAKFLERIIGRSELND